MLTPEILNKYHSRRKDELPVYRKALDTQDFSAIEQIGHKLKGNGITFGFPELSELGTKMETQAQEKNLAQLEDLLRLFEKWVTSTEGTFHESRPLVDFQA